MIQTFQNLIVQSDFIKDRNIIMKNKKLNNTIYYLIQDDQGSSNLYMPKIGTSEVNMHTIFNSVNKVVKNLRKENIHPLSVEIYSGELIQEELLFQMIYQEN